MKSSSVLKNLDNNYILIFLIILIGFVIIDCNTKIFSKMLEGNDPSPTRIPASGPPGNDPGSMGGNHVNDSGPTSTDGECNKCGRNCRQPQPNPTKGVEQNCGGKAQAATDTPNGYVEDEKLYVSATGSFGNEIPKTLQNNYSVLRSYGLTDMKDVVNFIPGDGPEQFLQDRPMTEQVHTGSNAADHAGPDQGETGKVVHMKMMYAPWCGWSKKVRPDFDKFKDEVHGQNVNGVTVHASVVDSEENKDEVKKHADKIQGFPTFLVEIYDGGEHVATEVVDVSERTYDGFVDAIKNITNNL